MSIYDHLRVKYPLPFGAEKAGDEYRTFQTKSFNIPYLEFYEIDEAGNLLQLCNLPNGTTSTQMLAFDEQMPRESVDYTGTLNFCTFWDEESTKGWAEFDAEFIHGKLQSIKIVELDKNE